MEIADQREMRQVRQKLLDPPRSSPVLLHTGVAPIRGLVRDGMLDNIAIAGVAISKKQAKALLLVNLDRGYKESPERV